MTATLIDRAGQTPRSKALLPIALAVIWLLLLPKVIPWLRFDRGIFVSVAERMLAGDALYQGVWDNKDPLFYYSIAVGRFFSPYADIVLELFWIVGACLATRVLARWRGCSPRLSTFLAFGMAPLILTGSVYVPGVTHLPGIALTLTVLAASVRRKYAAAGAIIGIIVFLKITILPVAFLLFAAVIVTRRQWQALLPAAMSFVAAVGVILGILGVRGELTAYMASLLLNVNYSQNSLVEDKGGSIVGHFLRVDSTGGIIMLATILLSLVYFAVKKEVSSVVDGSDDRGRILLSGIGASLIMGLAILGLTGVWPHHAQVLYVPAILVAIEAIHRFQRSFTARPAVTIAVMACFAVMLSGPINPTVSFKTLRSAPQYLADLGQVSPQTQAVLSIAKEGSYARVGRNDDDMGQAYGLRNWTLACPKFHQYAFDSPQTLHAVLECLPSADVVIVSPTISLELSNANWKAFHDGVVDILRSDYVCAPAGDAQICSRQHS